MPPITSSALSAPSAPFFNTPEKLTALIAACDRWRDTPFRENSAVPGPRGGVCCHMLAAHIYFATGALAPFEVPCGSARRLMHNPADTMLAYIDHELAGRFSNPLIEPSPVIAPGDFIVYREGATAKHIGIAAPGEQPHHGLRIFHVLRHSGANYSQYDDPTYAHNVVAIRRPILGAPSFRSA